MLINELRDINFIIFPNWSNLETAIACYLPIVTCPGEFMRGRHSYGFLQAMGVTETIADDASQYSTSGSYEVHPQI